MSKSELDNNCYYPECANWGTFSEDNCPGSDDETHHCYDCGELWWSKGLHCDSCEKYYCPSYWQNYFIFLDCDNCDNCDYESICPMCFLKMPELWCQKPEKCQCSQNIDKLKKPIKNKHRTNQ